MRELWTRGESSASEVHKALFKERGLAVTTIKTMLRKLEEYGCVTHRVEGRQFIYAPAIEEEEVRNGMVIDLVKRLFSGDSSALVHHLARAGELDDADLKELRSLVTKSRRKRGVE